MISNLANAGVSVPNGFATTADAYREFLRYEDLDTRIQKELDKLDVSDVRALAEAGARIRKWILEAPLPPELDRKSTRLNSSHVRISYAVFCLKKKNRIPSLSSL